MENDIYDIKVLIYEVTLFFYQKRIRYLISYPRNFRNLNFISLFYTREEIILMEKYRFGEFILKEIFRRYDKVDVYYEYIVLNHQ